MNNNEFNKFAWMHQGISSTTLSRYESAVDAYINPSIIEERKLNVAQLLFLASVDPKADISLYLNTPGGQVSSGLAIYDTMQLIQTDVATICTGMAASMGSVLLCDYWWIYYFDTGKAIIYHPVTEDGAITGEFIPYIWDGKVFAPAPKTITPNAP